MDSNKIMYYFNEVIKPTVTENKETIKVPLCKHHLKDGLVYKRGFYER